MLDLATSWFFHCDLFVMSFFGLVKVKSILCVAVLVNFSGWVVGFGLSVGNCFAYDILVS